QGGKETHKQSGLEVWVYELAKRARVARFELHNPTAAFVLEQAKGEPGRRPRREARADAPEHGRRTHRGDARRVPAALRRDAVPADARDLRRRDRRARARRPRDRSRHPLVAALLGGRLLDPALAWLLRSALALLLCGGAAGLTRRHVSLRSAV